VARVPAAVDVAAARETFTANVKVITEHNARYARGLET
jgi:hypothetical protein